MNLYTGVVEDRSTDPLKLGRCKVRVFGLHSANKIDLPTADLPWATLMQPVTSAAMSGIGQSPTGLVEGTIVVVMFTDQFQQQPIIIGSIGGIPVDEAAKVQPSIQSDGSVLTTSDGGVVTSSDGTPVTTGTPATQETAATPTLNKPSAMTPSSACYDSIHEEESLSSTVSGKNKYIRYKAAMALPAGTQLYAYQDTKGIWTIGWGSTYLANGSKVLETTRMTIEEANTLLQYTVEKTFAPGVRRMITVPITQSMFDALVSMAYNMGVGGLSGTAIVSSINSLDYEAAANQIPVTKTNGGTLTARRNREKTLFIKDGFPRKDMSGVDAPPVDPVTSETPKDATQNKVVKLKEDPTPASKVSGGGSLDGFRDPNAVYPKFFNEPDTHRLARNEKIDQTIVYAKEAARALGIVSGGGASWSQPPVPYNAKYPMNHARVTESGHVQEFDDTPGSERIHTYHRSGTFEEIDRNGTVVRRIVGDSFEIIERNGNVLVRGTVNLTVMGDSNIYVANDSNIDVLGNVNMTVGGNFKTGVTGDYLINCGGNFAVDTGGVVDYNSGKASGVQLGKGTASGRPQFSPLTTPSRHDEAMSQYETPEDGDPTEYNKALESAGVVNNDTPATGTEAGATPPAEKTEKTEDKVAEIIPANCSLIPPGTPSPSYKLSPNFTVGQFNGNSNIDSGLFGNTLNGLEISEILCNLKTLCDNCLEPILKLYPRITVTSGFRNRVPAGGASKSDHMTGCAADFVINGFSHEQHIDAAVAIAKVLPAWTQMIIEKNGNSTPWIHIAYAPKKGLRMEKFSMYNGVRTSEFGSFTTSTTPIKK